VGVRFRGSGYRHINVRPHLVSGIAYQNVSFLGGICKRCAI
jgi:hypothetical protein